MSDEWEDVDDLWSSSREIAALKQQLEQSERLRAAALALSEERRAWMETHSSHKWDCYGRKCTCGLGRLRKKEKEDGPPVE